MSIVRCPHYDKKGGVIMWRIKEKGVKND